MNTRFPVAPFQYSQLWFNELVMSLQRYFTQITAKDEETPRVILRSPNGTKYDLTVSDAGVLAVTPTSKIRV